MNNLAQISLTGLPQHTFVALPALARLRFQLPLVICLCAVLPWLSIEVPNISQPLALRATTNSFYASLISSIIGLLLFRRLGAFPGITSFGQVAPSVLGPYVGAVLIIVIARLDYSRPMLFMSAALAAALFYSLWLYCRRRCAPAIYVIPGADFNVSQAKVHQADLNVPPGMFERNPVIVANLRLELDAAWQDYILQAALSGVPVYHQKQLQESILGRVEIEHLSENSFGSLSPNQMYLRAKRALDLVAALALLPLLVVLLPFVAALIKLDSPGPVFFIQQRMGYRGKIFGMVKFRSMAAQGHAHGGREGAKTQDADTRITRVGRFLRRYRVDELPQVLNIIRGEMSWIGPRPEACDLSEWYNGEIPFYGFRHMVRPGITGWAQVHQGHVHDLTEVKEKLQYDFYYIKYFSAWLDALIVLRTLRTLLLGNGAK